MERLDAPMTMVVIRQYAIGRLASFAKTAEALQ